MLKTSAKTMVLLMAVRSMKSPGEVSASSGAASSPAVAGRALLWAVADGEVGIWASGASAA